MPILTIYPAADGFTATLAKQTSSASEVRAAAEAVIARAALRADQIDRVVFGTTPVHSAKGAEATALAGWAKDHQRPFSTFSCLRALAIAGRNATPSIAATASRPGAGDVAGAPLQPPSAQNAFSALAGAVSGPRRIIALIERGREVWIASFNAETVEPLEAEGVIPPQQVAMMDRLVQPALWAGDVHLVQTKAPKWAGKISGEILAAAAVPTSY